jgi:hypothetical protein
MMLSFGLYIRIMDYLFIFLSLVPLPDVFPLFIYLFIMDSKPQTIKNNTYVTTPYFWKKKKG